MTSTIEILFDHFTQNHQSGELLEAVQRISAELDRQIEAGAVQHNTLGEYELAATEYGFFAGFFAALELQNDKARL